MATDSPTPFEAPGAATWSCPACGKRFTLPAGNAPPRLCPVCRRSRAAAVPAARPPTPFEALAAAVAASEGRPAARAADREAAPIVFESRSPIESLPSPPKALATRTVFVRSPNWRRRRIALAVGAVFCIILGSWIFRDRPKMGQDAFQFLCPLVADFMKSPKSCEFPATGEIEPNEALGGWFVHSYVDAKNSFGVPLRSQWSAWARFNEKTKKWAVGYIDVEGERVFESEFLINLKAELAAEAKKKTDQRRADGAWEEVAEIEGRGTDETKSFKTTEAGWRIKWQPGGLGIIKVFSADRKLRETIRANKDEKRLLTLPAGEYFLRVDCGRNPYGWSILIEQ